MSAPTATEAAGDPGVAPAAAAETPPSTPAPDATDERDVLVAEIEATREHLAATVDELVAKADVTAQASRALHSAQDRVTTSVTERAGAATTQAQAAVARVQERAPGTPRQQWILSGVVAVLAVVTWRVTKRRRSRS
ncbi:DUF3618 domain-containing protein [Kineococcus xinjiangensis]|uniref:DUF3618 domain-containing protein n=1 Tax=Kineococcus xinjiangensis TaxID=512762 RepID=UPI001304F2DE|nr:DUF3618 domain-containing protein [Kineococcus xinjiangensis]